MGAYWIGRGAGCKGRRQMSDDGLTETPRIGVVIPLNVHGRVVTGTLVEMPADCWIYLQPGKRMTIEFVPNPTLIIIIITTIFNRLARALPRR